MKDKIIIFLVSIFIFFVSIPVLIGGGTLIIQLIMSNMYRAKQQAIKHDLDMMESITLTNVDVHGRCVHFVSINGMLECE